MAMEVGLVFIGHTNFCTPVATVCLCVYVLAQNNILVQFVLSTQRVMGNLAPVFPKVVMVHVWDTLILDTLILNKSYNYRGKYCTEFPQCVGTCK